MRSIELVAIMGEGARDGIGVFCADGVGVLILDDVFECIFFPFVSMVKRSSSLVKSLKLLNQNCFSITSWFNV